MFPSFFARAVTLFVDGSDFLFFHIARQRKSVRTDTFVLYGTQGGACDRVCGIDAAFGTLRLCTFPSEHSRQGTVFGGCFFTYVWHFGRVTSVLCSVSRSQAYGCRDRRTRSPVGRNGHRHRSIRAQAEQMMSKKDSKPARRGVFWSVSIWGRKVSADFFYESLEYFRIFHSQFRQHFAIEDDILGFCEGDECTICHAV